jgi:hypothetical protein
VNTDSNPLHCGGCGEACDNDQVCVDGNCEDYDAAIGCNSCPCDAQCGGGDACCPVPDDPSGLIICVNDGDCP